MPTPFFVQVHMRSARRWTRAGGGRAGLLLSALLVLGCGDQSLQPVPSVNQADLYWALELNHHAVVLGTMAPYKTLQLVATPRNFRGEPLTGLPAAQYVSRDPERLMVTSEGVLIAVAATTSPVMVYATLTAKNLKHTDSVLVSVVDTPAPLALASLSIHPLPPDSAKLPANIASATGSWPATMDTLPVRAVTVGGELLPVYTHDPGGFVPVDFRTSDTTVASFVVYPGTPVGVLRGRRRGIAQIYATTTVFGTFKADTLEYRFGWPVTFPVFLTPSSNGRIVLDQPDITIGLGGVVMWLTTPGELQPFDITFADADLPNVAAVAPVVDHFSQISPRVARLCQSVDCTTSGSFVLSESMFAQGRHFPVPGTYEYHSDSAGFNGRVVVVDER